MEDFKFADLRVVIGLDSSESPDSSESSESSSSDSFDSSDSSVESSSERLSVVDFVLRIAFWRSSGLDLRIASSIPFDTSTSFPNNFPFP